MNIIDIVMISIYNYAVDEKIEYNDMYNKLCSDIASYIKNNIILDNLKLEKNRQSIMQFLIVELDFNNFIQYEQQIINFINNNDILDNNIRNYENKISHKIIKIYQGFNQEQLILDIMDRLSIKQKIKSL